MENKIETREQLITLTNRKSLSVSGTTKIISLKTDLIQLETNQGGLQIFGENLELIRLDNQTNKAEISGTVNCLKFIQGKKEPILRKIFK